MASAELYQPPQPPPPPKVVRLELSIHEANMVRAMCDSVSGPLGESTRSLSTEVARAINLCVGRKCYEPKHYVTGTLHATPTE